MTNINRRSAIKLAAGAAAAVSLNDMGFALPETSPARGKPNVLFVMVDQQRFDTIAALGNQITYTPNIDRLVRRGITFANTYSPCPVCVPARYCIRTGCEPPTTRIFQNEAAHPAPGQPTSMTERCGPYIAQTMKGLGYRTFGIGKSHTIPWNEDVGFEVHLHSEELYATPEQRRGDAYAHWIATKQPQFNFIEGLMGERTEMYYMPQMSPMPPEITVEGWASSRAIEEIGKDDGRPYFGFVSFIGPHPPFAPPIPFNRLYDPDRMPNPILGKLDVDFMDEQIPFMNYLIFAEEVEKSRSRVLKARYYGEITYIDWCIGRVLDAAEKRADADNTVICFFSDHGDHLGDHHGWQKESFFESSCHVPLLVSWPAKFKGGEIRTDLACLTDLFGIATGAASHQDIRQGIDLLGLSNGTPQHRSHLVTYYGDPGTRRFKVMVRYGDWKYIFLANGGREQLFDLSKDPNELQNLATTNADMKAELKAKAVDGCRRSNMPNVLESSGLKAFSFEARPLRRIYQFDRSRGITGFPAKPEDVLKHWPFQG